MLPSPEIEKLPGTVCAPYQKCGRPDCECASGGKVHGPYWYRFWRDGMGKLHKTYVRKAGLERERTACAARQKEEQQIRGVLAKGEQIRRRLAGKREGDEPQHPLEVVKQVAEEEETLDDLMRVGCGKHGTSMHQVRCAKMLTEILIEMGELGPAPKKAESFRLVDMLNRPYMGKD